MQSFYTNERVNTTQYHLPKNTHPSAQRNSIKYGCYKKSNRILFLNVKLMHWLVPFYIIMHAHNHVQRHNYAYNLYNYEHTEK